MITDLNFCTRLLRTCNSLCSLPQGKHLHAHLFKSGLAFSPFVANCILQMYTRCNIPDLFDAHRLFDEMPHRNCFSWNSLIDAYMKANQPCSALELFNTLPQRNAFSWNATIAGLVRCGDLANARRLFEEMPVKEAIALNTVLHGTIRCGQTQEALLLYKKFASACTDGFVLATIVSACADHKALNLGKLVHARIMVSQVELDSVLGSALVNMYSKCEDLDNACRIFNLLAEPDEYSLSALVSGYASSGRIEDARRLFDRRDNRGVVLWNTMISGYASNGQEKEALVLFKKMRAEAVRVDSSTVASVLSACASSKQIHACTLKLGILEDIVAASALIDSYSKSGMWEDACRVSTELKVQDTVSLNSMINMYSNCGMIENARCVFDSIRNKSLISWNSMIVGYSQNGCAIEALALFNEMHSLDLTLDKVSLASALSASASICALGFGEQIFALATVTGLDSDQIIATSLIDFYCKCGNVGDGRRLFDGVNKSDEAPWNSMLMGYASNGYGAKVHELYEVMRNASVNPNEVTFISILSGCCHCGMVEEGLSWFREMKEGYGIKPIIEHYSCVVELLVRAGRLEEAVGFVDSMPFEADASMLTSILGGCKAQGDEPLKRKVAARLVRLNPHQSGPYVQLSGVYAANGEWEKSAGIRWMMRERRIKKSPAYSWIE